MFVCLAAGMHNYLHFILVCFAASRADIAKRNRIQLWNPLQRKTVCITQ